MNTLLRYLYFNGLIRFIVLFVLGLNVRNRNRLPKKGPAILIANHNSHLDTMVLMILLGRKLLPVVHPIAAADYFLKNRLIAWFALKIIQIVPLKRKREREDEDLLEPCYQALWKNQILIFFPEGSRGEPEKMSDLKSGIARLAEKFPDTPVHPVFMKGLGKSLPKGDPILVPFFCDVFAGRSLLWTGDKKSYLERVETSFRELNPENNQNPDWF